jgi:hypothetical protein
MSKNREQKRRLKRQKARRQAQTSPKKRSAPSERFLMPNASTIWRSVNLDFSVHEQIFQAAVKTQPSILQRDRGDIQRIEQAADLGALLDLSPVAIGLAEYPWLKRMRAFGDSAAPEIVARVNSRWMRSHGEA